jgi:Flp pilus assembly protein TadG
MPLIAESRSFAEALTDMHRHPSAWAVGRARGRGQSLVEWAVMMTVVLWLCIGGVDLGRAYGVYTGLTNAARVGARYAVLVPDATDAQVLAQVQSEQPSLGVTGSMITVDRSQTDRRAVAIAYPFTPYTPFVAALGDGTTLTLRTWAAMPTIEE